jgi:hypothetical protein
MTTRLIPMVSLLAGCYAGAPPPLPAGPPPPPYATPPPPSYAPPPGPVPLEQWAQVHSGAARELGDWVRTHLVAARRFFDWDGHHPARSNEFVWWTIAHPMQGLEAFVATHPGWPFFNEIMQRYRPATDTFMAWCRHYPVVARNPTDLPAEPITLPS